MMVPKPNVVLILRDGAKADVGVVPGAGAPDAAVRGDLPGHPEQPGRHAAARQEGRQGRVRVEHLAVSAQVA